MALDPAIVIEIAPEFTSDTRIAVYLAKTERRHNAAAWGAVYADAMALYTAHLLTRSPAAAASSAAAAGVPGVVASRGAGDLSEAYGDTSTGAPTSDAALRTTRYGLEYLELRASRASGMPTVITVNP